MLALVTRAHGQLGHELIRLGLQGIDVMGQVPIELAISDGVLVASVVAELQPERINNAEACTAVDNAESNMPPV